MARVYASSVIGASATRVWARVRDFNGLPNWHPAIAESRIENGEPSDKVGCIRAFSLRNGDRLREQMLGLSDYDMFCTYSILDSPMPLTNYVATLRLTPITDQDRCFIEWSGCVRRFLLQDGSELREQLISLSDLEMSYSYCLLDTPIPLFNYVAHIRLLPVTDGNRSFWHWEGRFTTPPGREEELARTVGEEVYVAGMEAVRQLPQLQQGGI